MKSRTIIKALLVFTLVSVVLGSCNFDEFLDKPPGVDVTEDTIFSTKRDIETFLHGTYMYGMHSYYPYYSDNSYINPNPNQSMTACFTDEGEMAGTFFNSQQWNAATIVRNNIKLQEDRRFDMRWTAIRRCNIIIERMQTDVILTQAERDQFTGEVLFIRALNNFEMLKRYGGMPIVDKRLQVNEEQKIPRATLDDFVKHIVNDCNESARLLKNVTYGSAQRGRVTDAAALALKSRTLLYAASPIFNAATPYISSGNPEVDALVCYGNYSEQRWTDAANATKEALDAIAKHGFALLNTGDPENDYRKTWNTNDNVEIILAEKYKGRVGRWSSPFNVMASIYVTANSSWGGATVNVPHNFIRKYEKKNGEPQTWNEVGVVGNDLMEKYAELDPRFRQTIAYQGSQWCGVEVSVHEGGAHNNVAENRSGAFMHKLLPTTWENGSYYTPNGMLFRVTELYLNYAEALNEAASSPSSTVYQYINDIRARAGMPNLPTGLSQGEMRERIKNERALELCFEDHRMWDIRRWMDAEEEGVMKGDFLGVKVKRISGSGITAKCDYELFVFERRSFNRNMYMHPIFEHEVNKGYLKQNPGW